MAQTTPISLAVRALAAVSVLASLLTPVIAIAEPVPVPADAVGARPSECGGALKTHAPITIATAADFTDPNKDVGVTGGSGTADDPYVISCWAITVPDDNTTGIAVSGAAAGVPLVIRDVELTGVPKERRRDNQGRGIQITGGSANSDITVERVTARHLSQFAIEVRVATGPVRIASNLVTDNFWGIDISNASKAVVEGNRGERNDECITRLANGSPGERPVVRGNTCVDGVEGFALQATTTGGGFIEVVDNIAEGNSGPGFDFQSGVFAHDNIARRNDTGYSITGSPVVERNVAEENTLHGINITAGVGSTIRDNRVVHNGSVGILAFAIGGAVPIHHNHIDGNQVGWNPFGIALMYVNNSNVVENTEWLDGHASLVRSGDANTIVDAGSNYRGLPDEDTRFHDWVAVAKVGGAGSIAEGDELTVVTSATWDFDDGSPHQALTPAAIQGQLPPDEVTHQYAAGTYHPTLTVTGKNNLGQDVTFTDATTVTIADSPASGLLPVPEGHEPWPSLANDPARTFYNGAETTITPGNVAGLDVKWRFPTTEPVTATPAVATIDIGGTPTEAVFDGSYSGTMYALRASNGSPLWINCLIEGASLETGTEPFCDPQIPQNVENPDDPDRQQAYGAIVDSPAVAKVALPGGVTEDRVFVGVGGARTQMVALNANSGAEIWRFTAADSAPTYSVSGSPLVIGDTVLFGIDCNNKCSNGSGIYAVSAIDGTLKWFWDVHSGRNFVSPPGDKGFDPGEMRGNDEIDLQPDCGAVWSSPAVDVELGLAFVGTADCTAPLMTPYEEAVVALDLQTGAPAWSFQPRQRDKRDMDFGATPNVFKIGNRHVVGAGGKDGVYYALDAQTGEKIWSTKLALGGNFGGFYGTATDGERIYLTNAISEAAATPDGTFILGAHEERLKGMEFALDARTGNVLWIQHLGSPTVGMNSVSPGIYWSTGLDHNLHAWRASDGLPLGVWNVQGAASSAPAIANGHVYVGAGTGATYRAAVGDSDPFGLSGVKFPHPIPVTEYGQGIYSFCLTSEPDCVASRADPESAKGRTIVTYNDAVATGDHHDDVTVSATLHDALVEPLGFPVEGATLTFTVDGDSCTTGPTDATGTASCTLRLDSKAGANTIKTSYAGDDVRRASDDFDGFIVTKEQTALAYVGEVQLTDTESVGLGAKLTEDDGAPVPDAEVTFTIGDQSCTATTGGGGIADCNVDLDQPVGAASVVADFAGDDFYQSAQLSTPVTVAAPATGGQGPGPGPGDECPAEKSAAQLGSEPPVAAGGTVAGATIGFPFVSRRLGRPRRRGRGRGALLPLAVTGAVMALTLSGCGFFGGPSPTPGC